MRLHVGKGYDKSTQPAFKHTTKLQQKILKSDTITEKKVDYIVT